MELIETQPMAETRKSSAGLILAGVTGGIAVGLSILCYPFVSPALRRVCLPYVPATTAQISNVFQALKGRQGTLLDIGSGDGRIVLEAARRGFNASGVELNYWLVLYSKWSAFKSGLYSAQFHRKDLWSYRLDPFENVVIFGVKEMMEELDKKFESELKDALVVACRFPIPNREPIKIIGEGIDTVWLYSFPSKSANKV